MHVFLMDVQGVDIEDELNLKMQLLSLLLSDVVVFYSQNRLAEVLSKELHFLLEISRRLRFDILDA